MAPSPRHAPTRRRANGPTCQCTDVPTHRCADAPMCRCSGAALRRCSHLPAHSASPRTRPKLRRERGCPALPRPRTPRQPVPHPVLPTEERSRGLRRPWEELELLPGDGQRWGGHSVLQPRESPRMAWGSAVSPAPGDAVVPDGHSGSSRAGSRRSPVYTAGPLPARAPDNPAVRRQGRGGRPRCHGSPGSAGTATPAAMGARPALPSPAPRSPPAPAAGQPPPSLGMRAAPSQWGQDPAPGWEPSTPRTRHAKGRTAARRPRCPRCQRPWLSGPSRAGGIAGTQSHPPPGTGRRSRAGDAVPGCSAPRCAWGRGSLSSSSPPRRDSAAPHCSSPRLRCCCDGRSRAMGSDPAAGAHEVPLTPLAATGPARHAAGSGNGWPGDSGVGVLPGGSAFPGRRAEPVLLQG